MDGTFTFSAAIELDGNLLVHVLGQVQNILLLRSLAIMAALCTAATAAASTAPEVTSAAIASAAAAAASMRTSLGHCLCVGGDVVVGRFDFAVCDWGACEVRFGSGWKELR